MAGARNSGDWPEAGLAGSCNQPYCLRGESSLFCIEWWGGPGVEFSLQAILSRVTFLHSLPIFLGCISLFAIIVPLYIESWFMVSFW